MLFSTLVLLLIGLNSEQSPVPCSKILSNASLMPEPYNPRFDKQNLLPGYYLYACSEEDVIGGLTFCQLNDLTCVVRSNAGHSYIGQSTTDGGLVIDMSRLNGVQYDATLKYASVGAGTRLIEVYSRLFYLPIPVAFAGGSCPSVSVGGLVQGGGHGLSSGKWGITSDSLIGADVIVYSNSTLDSHRFRLVHASMDNEHSALLKALRGGMGGNYGVVTRYYFQSDETQMSPSSVLVFVFSKQVEIGDSIALESLVDKVLHMQHFIRNLNDPNALYVIFKLIRSNSTALDSLVLKVEGQCFCDNDHGGCDHCENIVLDSMIGDIFNTSDCSVSDTSYLTKCAFEIESFGKAMWTWAGCSDFSGPSLYPGDTPPSEDLLVERMNECSLLDKAQNGKPYKAKSLYLPSIVTVDILLKAVNSLTKISSVCGENVEGYTAPQGCILQFDLYAGKMLNRPSGCGLNADEYCDSFFHRNESWHLQVLAYWEKQAEGSDYASRMVDWTRDVAQVLLPLSLGQSYQNYIDDDLTRSEWESMYFDEETYRYLQRVKCLYNSINMFNRTSSMSVELPVFCS